MANVDAGGTGSGPPRPVVFRVRDMPIELFGGKHGRHTRKLVLLTITTHANSDGTSCYPAVATIAREVGLTPRATQMIIAWLQRAGFLVVSLKAGPHHTNTFTLRIPEDLGVVKPSLHGEAQPSPRRELTGVVKPSLQGGGEAQASPDLPNTYANNQPFFAARAKPARRRSPRVALARAASPQWEKQRRKDLE